MASDVEDEELMALRSAVLASMKQKVNKENQSADADEDREDPELAALREAALKSKRTAGSNNVPNKQAEQPSPRKVIQPRSVNLQKHGQFGKFQGPGMGKQRGNLITIQTVPMETGDPHPVGKPMAKKAEFTLLRPQDRWASSGGGSDSDKAGLNKPKTNDKFSRFESSESDSDDSDKSDVEDFPDKSDKTDSEKSDSDSDESQSDKSPQPTHTADKDSESDQADKDTNDAVVKDLNGDEKTESERKAAENRDKEKLSDHESESKVTSSSTPECEISKSASHHGKAADSTKLVPETKADDRQQRRESETQADVRQRQRASESGSSSARSSENSDSSDSDSSDSESSSGSELSSATSESSRSDVSQTAEKDIQGKLREPSSLPKRGKDNSHKISSCERKEIDRSNRNTDQGKTVSHRRSSRSLSKESNASRRSKNNDYSSSRVDKLSAHIEGEQMGRRSPKQENRSSRGRQSRQLSRDRSSPGRGCRSLSRGRGKDASPSQESSKSLSRDLSRGEQSDKRNYSQTFYQYSPDLRDSLQAHASSRSPESRSNIQRNANQAKGSIHERLSGNISSQKNERATNRIDKRSDLTTKTEMSKTGVGENKEITEKLEARRRKFASSQEVQVGGSVKISLKDIKVAPRKSRKAADKPSSSKSSLKSSDKSSESKSSMNKTSSSVQEKKPSSLSSSSRNRSTSKRTLKSSSTTSRIKSASTSKADKTNSETSVCKQTVNGGVRRRRSEGVGDTAAAGSGSSDSSLSSLSDADSDSDSAVAPWRFTHTGKVDPDDPNGGKVVYERESVDLERERRQRFRKRQEERRAWPSDKPHSRNVEKSKSSTRDRRRVSEHSKPKRHHDQRVRLSAAAVSRREQTSSSSVSRRDQSPCSSDNDSPVRRSLVSVVKTDSNKNEERAQKQTFRSSSRSRTNPDSNETRNLSSDRGKKTSENREASSARRDKRSPAYPARQQPSPAAARRDGTPDSIAVSPSMHGSDKTKQKTRASSIEGSTGSRVVISQPDIDKKRSVVSEPDIDKKRSVVSEPDTSKKSCVVSEPDTDKKRSVVSEPDTSKKSCVVSEPDTDKKHSVVNEPDTSKKCRSDDARHIISSIKRKLDSDADLSDSPDVKTNQTVSITFEKGFKVSQATSRLSVHKRLGHQVTHEDDNKSKVPSLMTSRIREKKPHRRVIVGERIEESRKDTVRTVSNIEKSEVDTSRKRTNSLDDPVQKRSSSLDKRSHKRTSSLPDDSYHDSQRQKKIKIVRHGGTSSGVAKSADTNDDISTGSKTSPVEQDLDEKIRKIKEQNAAILRRKAEIERDKRQYGF